MQLVIESAEISGIQQTSSPSVASWRNFFLLVEGTTPQTSSRLHVLAFILSLALYNTHVRSTSDYHLQEIAKYCCELEQLDILGTNKVTMEGVSMWVQ